MPQPSLATLEKPATQLTRAQIVVALFCVAASLKILFFSVSLPFFPLDEELHFDAIYKFANGYHKSRDLPGFDHNTAEIIERYHSPQFLRVPDPGRPFVPLAFWCHPSDEHLPPELQSRTEAWLQLKNIEINAPPVYYELEAAWYKLGRLMGYSGLFLLYWLRALNAVGYGFFVLFSWMFIRECYPENSYLQLAVPVFLLVFPQDCFLFLIPNALCATFMAAALVLFARLRKNPDRSLFFYLLAGALAPITALLGFGNFLVSVPLLLIAFLILKDSRGQGTRTALILKTASMLAAAALPIVTWLTHNYLVLGNWSGSKSKQEFLTWSVKPFSEWLHHPLFTPSGFAYFVSTLSRNFWRGEVYWAAAPRTAWIDPIYLGLSLILCGIYFVHVIRRRSLNRTQSFADFASISLLIASVLFLAFISLPFDFGRCFYPSRAHPYFVSGRLIIGALLPFLIAFLGGLQLLCARISKRLNPLYVAISLAAGIFVTETVLFIPILSSRFNLISLILGRSCS
jgi:hypothetical protein